MHSNNKQLIICKQLLQEKIDMNSLHTVALNRETISIVEKQVVLMLKIKRQLQNNEYHVVHRVELLLRAMYYARNEPRKNFPRYSFLLSSMFPYNCIH